jgi:hypothetical protein
VCQLLGETGFGFVSGCYRWLFWASLTRASVILAKGWSMGRLLYGHIAACFSDKAAALPS